MGVGPSARRTSAIPPTPTAVSGSPTANRPFRVDPATITATNFYTAEPLNHNLLKIMHSEGIHGARWYYSLPPIEGLSFEVDVRCTYRDEWI